MSLVYTEEFPSPPLLTSQAYSLIARSYLLMGGCWAADGQVYGEMLCVHEKPYGNCLKISPLGLATDYVHCKALHWVCPYPCDFGGHGCDIISNVTHASIVG